MALKITDSDFAALKDRITAAMTNFPEASVYQSKGLSHTRWRWDLFWHSGGAQGLYGYLCDAHIDSALRAIVGDSF